MAKAMVYVTGCITVGVLLYLSYSAPVSDLGPISNPASSNLKPKYQTATPRLTPIERYSDECKIGQPKSISDFAISSTLDNAKDLENLNRLSFERPDLVVAKAKDGDGQAAVALFKMLGSCYPIYSINPAVRSKSNFEACPKITPELIDDPLSILEAALSRGDVVAELTFAVNASLFVEKFRKIGTNESVVKALELQKRSEQLGEAAAKKGSKEAFYFMAQSYQTGLFGVRDPQKAYAYAVEISKFDHSIQFQENLSVLEKNIGVKDRRILNRTLVNCENPSDPEILINPFERKE